MMRIVNLVASACVLLAQQDTRSNLISADERWAWKNEIAAAGVREMRTLAGIHDDTAGAGILHLDAISLRHRGHSLLVEAGAGHCMRLHVFERTGSGIKKIWALAELPETGWTVPGSGRQGRGICSKAPKKPEAYATADGHIVLEVPVMTDAFQRSIPVESFVFAWNGKDYALIE
jgi:hypothetical protein